VPVALDIERAVLAPELHQVHRRQVARGVVEEHELGAVVDDEPVRHEVAGHGLGEVENLLFAERIKGHDDV
jgi:hypothetical protein